MQSRFRLTRSEEFNRVRQTGKSYAHPLLVLVARPCEGPHLRVGVTAARGIGTAVNRNRAKRLLRESMRPMLPRLARGWNMVLIARPSLASASLADIRSALAGLLQRAGLLRVDES